jgi:hypothetical protein
MLSIHLLQAPSCRGDAVGGSKAFFKIPPKTLTRRIFFVLLCGDPVRSKQSAKVQVTEATTVAMPNTIPFRMIDRRQPIPEA